MSFNDLKPIYKEFLLKLSVTLTKDELYQRSKSIMRRQKKKLLRRNSSVNAKKGRHHILVGGKFRRLKHIFQKNLKMRLRRKVRHAPQGGDGETPPQADQKLPESSISTSSYDTRQFRTREELNVNGRKQGHNRKKSGDRNRNSRDRHSTSEESDFFSLKRSKAKSQGFNLLHNQNRNSSSGYVSCSECSYDSDTCTCVSADKCYCSLGGNNNKNFPKKAARCPGVNCRAEGKCRCDPDATLTFCECDTDSCTESNKCYCTPGRHVGRGESHHNHKKLCKKKSNSKSTRSLEYILNPSESYYEKLKLSKSRYGSRRSGSQALDYELFSHAGLRELQNLKNLQNGALYSRNYYEGGGGGGGGGFGLGKQSNYGSIRSRGTCEYFFFLLVYTFRGGVREMGISGVRRVLCHLLSRGES